MLAEFLLISYTVLPCQFIQRIQVCIDDDCLPQKDPLAVRLHFFDCRYVDTPVFTGHTKDARQQKLAQGKAKREAEKALLNLAARSEPKAEGRPPKGAKLGTNPFLASPERATQYVLLCTKNDAYILPLQCFVPGSCHKQSLLSGRLESIRWQSHLCVAQGQER